MSRIKTIFIGPNYPPKAISDSILGLSVNVSDIKYIQGKMPEDSVSGINYITNIVSKSNFISFDVFFINPITKEFGSIRSSDNNVLMTIPAKSLLPIFSSGNIIYPISPCCITLSYPNDLMDKYKTSIVCKHPLEATILGNTLKIEAMDIFDTFNTLDVDINYGIKAINGMSAKNNDINIRGVGSVSVAVNGNKEDVE